MIYDLQKASALKRISAFILDIIIIAILASGFMLAISAITNFDKYDKQLNDYYEQYENDYDIKLNISEDEYNKLTPEEKENYDNAIEAMNKDKEVLKTYTMIFNLILLITSLGIFLSVLISEFIIPLIFKNGETVGKKIFGLCVVKNNSVKISTLQLFIRSILAKYTIEIMIPVLIIICIVYSVIGIVGFVVLLGLLITQLFLFFSTKYRTVIHDSLAYTVVVDKSSQMIFNSEEELIKYKEELHRQDVIKQKY